MNPLQQLTAELAKLPAVGEKTALRLALYILRQPADYAKRLSQSLLSLVEKMGFCQTCFHFSDTDPCAICRDATRDSQVLCVVEESTDLLAIERTRGFRGKYHVLQGSLSPLDGIGPDQLRISELLSRLRTGEITEVVLATNHNVTGDATSLYLARCIKPLGIRVTKLAGGIPVGGDIQYLDSLTLTRALESRIDWQL